MNSGIHSERNRDSYEEVAEGLDLIAQELHPDDWQRLRDIRLASLLDSREAFGADYEVMSKFGEQ